MLRRALSGPWCFLFVPLAILLAQPGPTPGADPSASGVRNPQELAPRPDLPHAAGEVLIKFRPTATAAERRAVRQGLGATAITDLGETTEQSRISGLTVAEALERYVGHPAIEIIEPNYLLRSQVLPNDPNLNLQWGLRNFGQTGGTQGADVDAESAWDFSTGSEEVVVAILDSGIDYQHFDLVDNIWSNPDETLNGVDDDGNGLVDDVRGWDFIGLDNQPLDENGHGTHVAGITGAIGNNGLGITGVAWNVSLLGCRMLNADGMGFTSAAIQCIDYCVSEGVDVINASWGGSGPSAMLSEAIERANDAGILFVAAAGNSNPGVDTDILPFYPAGFDIPNIISVAATDHNDNLWAGSNFGATTVDLAAPGADILSTFPGDSFAFINGTSMAAPHVSGALALIFSRFTGIGPFEAKQLLLERVDPLQSLLGKVASGGRLNIHLPIADADEIPPAPIDDLITTETDATRIDLEWSATGDDLREGVATRYEVRYSTAPITETNYGAAPIAPDPPRPQAPGSRETMRVDGLEFSTLYYFAVRAFDEFGNGSEISNVATGLTTGAPDVEVTPASLSETLLVGQQVTRTLTLSNVGEGEYTFDIVFNRAVGASSSATPVVSARPGVVSLDGDPASGPLPFRPYGPDSTVALDVTANPPLVATGVAEGLNIAILQSGADVAELVDELSQFPEISQIAVMDGRLITPPLEELLPFHATIVVANLPFGEPAAMGDILADYVDAGRGLVLTLASFILGWEFEGRFLSEGYYPFELGSGPIGQASLGDFLPDHPIMAGVTDAAGDLLGDVDLAPQAELIALWDNGEPAVAVKNFNVAAVNVYVAGEGFWQGDVPLILRNAAFWSSNVITWLRAEPSAGVLAAGGSLEVEVTFNSRGLIGGEYNASVLVRGNDPDEPNLAVPAELIVLDAPDVELSQTTIDFGALFVGDEVSDTITVSNFGTETLEIGSIGTDGGPFSVDVSSLSLAPAESADVEVHFEPAVAGPVAGELRLTTNDPDEQNLTIELTGTGLTPPDITVSPLEFRETLFAGETADHTLVIQNSGGSDLEYEIAVQPINLASGAQGAPAPVSDLPSTGSIGSRPGRALLPSETAGPPVDLSGLASTVLTPQGAPFLFEEDFEDGNFDGWMEADAPNLREVTELTAANGSLFSYHQLNGPPGHYNGIYQVFGEQHPTYASAWVRSASVETNDAYFVMRDASGLEAIWFFANEDGFFYCNGDVEGDFSYAYEAERWYHIEFKNIDFETKTFDYYIDDQIIKIGIPFRHADDINNFQRLDLYNFNRDSEAWWDEIVVADEEPAVPVRVFPEDGRVPAGQTVEVTVRFDTRGLNAGTHLADIVVVSNDPDQSHTLINSSLTVIGAPDIDTPGDAPAFGDVFVGGQGQLLFNVANEGTDLLTVSSATIDDPRFAVEPASFSVEPDASLDLTVTFTPDVVGARQATLTILSDDPDEPELQIPVTGRGVVPPTIEVDPDSMSQDLFTGQLATQPLTIRNVSQGGRDLEFEVDIVEGFTVLPAAPSGSGFTFREDFETGRLESDWFFGDNSSTKEVTDETAAAGTTYSYHEFDSPGGHFSGIYQTFDPTLPVYASVWVRPGATDSADCYFALRNRNGIEGIFFFASSQGRLYINEDSGGNTDVTYEPDRWYHIEFRNIDFLRRRFDYYVDEVLIQSGVPFRNAPSITEFSRVDMYNFSPGGEGYWDQIVISSEPPVEPITVDARTGSVPEGQGLELSVLFNASGLFGGDYPADIVIRSNDPLTPEVTVPVAFNVTGASDIALAVDSLRFEPTFVGASSARVLQVTNAGTDTLSVDDITTGHSDFSVDATSFELEPEATRDVVVTFTPTTDASLEADLVISSNDPDEGTVVVSLEGQGRFPPIIEVEPTSLGATLSTGQTTTQTIDIGNAGQSDLVWQISLGSIPPPWLIVAPSSGFSRPGESDTVNFRFDATGIEGGVYDANIRVSSNDPATPTVSVTARLEVLPAPDIKISIAILDYGDVFIGARKDLPLTITNIGSDPLEINNLLVQGEGFEADRSEAFLGVGDSVEVLVTFAPEAVGLVNGSLTIFSNDPDDGELVVDMIGRGLTAPEIAVAPESFGETLESGDMSTRELTISNLTGSNLFYTITVEGTFSEPVMPQGAADSETDDTFVDPALLVPGPADTLGAPIPLDIDPGLVTIQGSEDGILFADDFEDGDLEDWIDAGGEGIKEVTDQTAANGTRFSYHEFGSRTGHVDGIYQDIGPLQAGYIGFWIRSASTVRDDAYFMLRDRNGQEVIWFYARQTGEFYVNADVGGDANVPYEENVWYFIEFKNIDFESQTFDYFFNRQRIKRNIPFRNAGLVTDFTRLDLYNFSQGGQAWWDEIVFSEQEPFTMVTVDPALGAVAPGTSQTVDVLFDATNLIAGRYGANIVVNSNDPDNPVVEIPAELDVFGFPDIGTSQRVLSFGTVQIGIPGVRALTVTNFGTDILNISDIQVTDPTYEVNVTSFNLAPEASRSVTVTLDPTVPGSYPGTLTIFSNDPDRPQLEHELIADAQFPPKLIVAPELLTETKLRGETSTQTLRIDNPGGQTLAYVLSLLTDRGAPVPSIGVVWKDDVEDGEDDWVKEVYTEDDLWHRTQKDANSPETSWWCGQEAEGHYATPNPISTALVSLPVDMRELQAPITLNFFEKYQTEPGWDQCLVDISIDGGDSWIHLRGEYGQAPSGDSRGWIREAIDLSAYAGEIVRVRFYFETLDATNNAFPGWFVDDVVISAQGTPWISVEPDEGSIPPGGSQEIQVLFDATRFRPDDRYESTLAIASNDPFLPLKEVPATMEVKAPPSIGLPGPIVTATSSQEPSPHRTEHSFPVTARPGGPGTLRLDADGNFGDDDQTATAVAEAFVIGTTGGTGESCTTASDSFTVSALELLDLARDGRIEINVRNSPEVGLACPINQHVLTLSYPSTIERLDFGELVVGGTSTLPLVVANNGDGPLEIVSIGSEADDVHLSDTSLSVAPRSATTLTITYEPRDTGVLGTTLGIVSNDPATPLVTVELIGSALSLPAEAVIEPDALVAALPPNSHRTRTKHVRLGNRGEGDLVWSADSPDMATVTPTSGVVVPGEFVDVEVNFASQMLDEGDYTVPLVLHTNDPANERMEIPLTLHVREVELMHFTVDFSPKFAHRDGTVEVAMQLPDHHDPKKVLLSTVTLEGVPALDEPVYYHDMNRDGHVEAILQFDLRSFLAALPDADVIPVTLTGEVEDTVWFTRIEFLRGVARVDP